MVRPRAEFMEYFHFFTAEPAKPQHQQRDHDPVDQGDTNQLKSLLSG